MNIAFKQKSELDISEILDSILEILWSLLIMRTMLIWICVLSFLTLVILCLVIKNNKNKKIKSFDNRIGKVINIISSIGVIFSVLTLLISIWGIMLQIRKPKLQVEIYTVHGVSWEEENGERELCLSYDNDGHVDFAMSMPNVWHLHIKNEGNQYAENVKIKIRFSEFAFASQPDYFTLTSFNYGMGTYAVIEHIFDEDIQPDEYVEVPGIPLKNAELYEFSNPNYTNMNIKIYENNSLVLEKNFFLKFIDNEMIEDTCALMVYTSDEDKIVRKLNDYYFKTNGNKYFLFESHLNLELIPLYPRKLTFSLEDYENVYRHYLKLINVYNPTMASIYNKLAVFYGRLYYYGLSKEMPEIDIEQAIENDMTIQQKYEKY